MKLSHATIARACPSCRPKFCRRPILIGASDVSLEDANRADLTALRKFLAEVRRVQMEKAPVAGALSCALSIR